MKKNYTHKKKRSKQKGGWKWPWETDKVSSKKTKKNRYVRGSIGKKGMNQSITLHANILLFLNLI